MSDKGLAESEFLAPVLTGGSVKLPMTPHGERISSALLLKIRTRTKDGMKIQSKNPWYS